MSNKPDLDSLASMCTGLVLARLFASPAGAAPIVGRPHLAQALCRPNIAEEPLSDLGVDSLAWLELLTALEAELGVEIGSDLLVDTHVSAGHIGGALSRRLAAGADRSRGVEVC